MIDSYGQWHEEKDYATYPKEKWCDYDYVADWIRKQDYEIKTDMKNLVMIIYMRYDDEKESSYYAVKDPREFPDNLMVYMPDIEAFVEDIGGLEAFDYRV